MYRSAARLTSVVVAAIVTVASCAPACLVSRSDKAAVSTPVAANGVPAGFMEMKVMGVMPTGEGHAVFLAGPDEDVVLPIWIGGTEAMSIQLRLDRRRFERPLTHDLLDSLLKELGGELVKVHVDDLKSSTFVGTVFVRANDRVVAVDARPSDAIALALGSRVPIYVSEKVVGRAGLRKSELDLDDPEPEAPTTPPLEMREPEAPVTPEGTDVQSL